MEMEGLTPLWASPARGDIFHLWVRAGAGGCQEGCTETCAWGWASWIVGPAVYLLARRLWTALLHGLIKGGSAYLQGRCKDPLS